MLSLDSQNLSSQTIDVLVVSWLISIAYLNLVFISVCCKQEAYLQIQLITQLFPVNRAGRNLAVSLMGYFISWPSMSCVLGARLLIENPNWKTFAALEEIVNTFFLPQLSHRKMLQESSWKVEKF